MSSPAISYCTSIKLERRRYILKVMVKKLAKIKAKRAEDIQSLVPNMGEAPKCWIVHFL